MTMIDAPTEAPKPAKPKRAKKKRTAKPPAAPKSEFAGLTAADCCTACGPAGCVISGSVCAHPRKGGLQGTLMADPAKLKRFLQAQTYLKKQGVA